MRRVGDLLLKGGGKTTPEGGAQVATRLRHGQEATNPGIEKLIPVQVAKVFPEKEGGTVLSSEPLGDL